MMSYGVTDGVMGSEYNSLLKSSMEKQLDLQVWALFAS